MTFEGCEMILIFIDDKLPDNLRLSIVISSILIDISGKVGKVACNLNKTTNATKIFLL